jgi:ubiquinone/menaquinone biosynthesis C-methylase UbiE
MKNGGPSNASRSRPSVFLELNPGASSRIAAHLLDLCPTITSGSVIHDNACGAGVITNEIMKAIPSAANSTSGISIYATGLSLAMVEACRTRICENDRSDTVSVSHMGMQDLTLPNDTFTHSLTNFAIFSLPDNEAARAASHIYCTLKPGGTAAITTWAEGPHKEIIQSIHESTRHTTSLLPLMKNLQWQDPAHLKRVLQGAGFAADKISLSQQEVFPQIKDLDRWSQVLWTLMGRPADGWVEGDEGNWDYAVETIKERIVRTEGFHYTEEGEPRVKMMANIAIAIK